eukprot:15446076-Alexandrium_andersonii.AAC.1
MPWAWGRKKTQKRCAERKKASKHKAARWRERARATDRMIGDALPQDRWPAMDPPRASASGGSESNPRAEGAAVAERAAALNA